MFPNITGYIKCDNIGENSENPQATSALQYLLSTHPRQQGGAGNSIYSITLNAAISSAIYGASNTVQVAASQLLMIIKI